MKEIENFRIKGHEVAVLHQSSKEFECTERVKLLVLKNCILNKDEVLELINWLILKQEEM
jgi:hypothetical protein